MSKILNALILVILSGTFAACSSEPKVTEISNTADSQVEIDRVAGNIHRAQLRQVDVLSPKNYGLSEDHLEKAKKTRAKNGDHQDVLHHVAVAQGYLDRASRVADVGTPLLKGPIQARKDALAANAYKNYPKETAKADKSFKNLTEEIEDGDTSGAEGKSGSLEADYRKIELESIQMDRLGPAKYTMEQAVKEGAEKLTPKTLAWAKDRFAKDEAVIVQDRHNTAEVVKASNDATQTADRLLKMVRNAKGSTAKNPEDFAMQNEKTDQATLQSENELARSEAALAATEGRLATASGQNEKLESQMWLDKEYDAANSQFTKDEAEVYKQGNKLLLRLKGLSFGVNKSEINSENFPLLVKVQKVIGGINGGQVEIEGHTDSLGGSKQNEQLSAKRAQSVKSYLVSNNNVAADKVTAKGFGYSKPIATNKTAEGRAQNRRVDIIITAE